MDFLRRHWRNLASRLALLVMLAVVLVLLIVGGYFDLFLRRSFEQATAQRMVHAYQRLGSELEGVFEALVSSTTFAQTNERLIASTELINRYEDRQQYSLFLIDEEKKLLAQEMLKRVKLSYNDDIALYGEKNELIAFAFRDSGGYRLGYVSHAGGERTIFSRLEEERYYQPGGLPVHFKVENTLRTPDQGLGASQVVTMHARGGALVVQVHQHLAEPRTGRQIAHLELSRILDRAYFERLSADVNVGLSLVFDTPAVPVWSNLMSLPAPETLTPQEIQAHYLSAVRLPIVDGKAYVQAQIPSNLHTDLLTRHRSRFAMLLLVLGVVILWGARRFIRRTLTKPLERLMAQIHRIERGDYTLMPAVTTGDELQSISTSINLLATAVQEREAALERARHEQAYLSNHDVMTALPNRRFFAERLEHALDLARREHTQLAVLFMDLDQFKMVNDTLGHDVGDQLLIQVGQRLAQHVGPADTLARIGGDEFNVLIEQVPNLAQLEIRLGEMLASFREPFVCGDRKLKATISIGVALYPRDGTDSVSLLKHADLAVYKSKDRGRAAYSFFSEELSQRARQRAELILALNNAIAAGNEFLLHYQPKMDAQTGRVVAAEALIRWNSPEFGWVSPARFIPMAEETGQILEVGAWVARQVCQDLAILRAAQVELDHLSFNVSGVQLRSDELRQVLEGAIEAYGLQPHWLEMEITESFIGTDMAQAIATLESFRAMGLQLAIDDFGTGYSSMSYLHKLPFTRVKVDKSFVDGLPDNPDGVSITRAVLSLAKHFGLATTAEGVETEAQYQFLRQEGCDEIQGYYFSKPLPLPDFVAFYQRHLGQERPAPTDFNG